MLTRDPKLALFSQFQSFISAALDEVLASFEPHDGGGVMLFTFPEPVPPLVADCWHGPLEVGFSLLKTGHVVGRELSPTTHRYVLSWLPKPPEGQENRGK